MRSAFLLFSVLVASPALRGQSDWPAYGGDLGNRRYSALDQINSQNITNLGQAWVSIRARAAVQKRIARLKQRRWL